MLLSRLSIQLTCSSEGAKGLLTPPQRESLRGSFGSLTVFGASVEKISRIGCSVSSSILMLTGTVPALNPITNEKATVFALFSASSSQGANWIALTETTPSVTGGVAEDSGTSSLTPSAVVTAIATSGCIEHEASASAARATQAEVPSSFQGSFTGLLSIRGMPNVPRQPSARQESTQTRPSSRARRQTGADGI